jgi:hypothetical protein
MERACWRGAGAADKALALDRIIERANERRYPQAVTLTAASNAVGTANTPNNINRSVLSTGYRQPLRPCD